MMNVDRTEYFSRNYLNAPTDEAKAVVMRDWVRWNESHGLAVPLGVTKMGAPVYGAKREA
jgi:hypothetical protein